MLMAACCRGLEQALWVWFCRRSDWAQRAGIQAAQRAGMRRRRAGLHHPPGQCPHSPGLHNRPCASPPQEVIVSERRFKYEEEVRHCTLLPCHA